MKDIKSPKSDSRTSVLLDRKAHNSILVCNGATNMDARTTIVCVRAKVLPREVAIAERPWSGGARRVMEYKTKKSSARIR
jgi:hypothetical protein